MNPINSFSQMISTLQTMQLTNLMIQAVLPSVLPNSQKQQQEEATIVAVGTKIDGVAIVAGSTVVSGGRVFKAL